MTPAIRRASLDDIDWLLGQLQDFAAVYGTKRSLFPTGEHARAGVKMLVENHLVLVAQDLEAGNVGFIAGYVLAHPYNPALRILQEAFWWVAPEHRGTRAGLLLLEEFVAWGRENVDWVTCAIEAESPIDERCLTKRGFRLHERSYLLEV